MSFYLRMRGKRQNMTNKILNWLQNLKKKEVFVVIK